MNGPTNPPVASAGPATESAPLLVGSQPDRPRQIGFAPSASGTPANYPHTGTFAGGSTGTPATDTASLKTAPPTGAHPHLILGRWMPAIPGVRWTGKDEKEVIEAEWLDGMTGGMRRPPYLCQFGKRELLALDALPEPERFARIVAKVQAAIERKRAGN